MKTPTLSEVRRAHNHAAEYESVYGSHDMGAVRRWAEFIKLKSAYHAGTGKEYTPGAPRKKPVTIRRKNPKSKTVVLRAKNPLKKKVYSNRAWNDPLAYRLWQKTSDRGNHFVAAFKHRLAAVEVAKILNERAAKGVKFIVKREGER